MADQGQDESSDRDVPAGDSDSFVAALSGLRGDPDHTLDPIDRSELDMLLVTLADPTTCDGGSSQVVGSAIASPQPSVPLPP